MFKPGQIVENHLVNGSVIICRVIGKLDFIGAEGMYRLADARETATDAELIRTDRTWGAPVENIKPHDNECLVCHKDGLVFFGGV